MSLPAQCTKCLAIFWSRSFQFADSVGAIVSDCTERCPIHGCGGVARLADGLFNFTSRGIEVLSAPQTTIAMLEALKETLERARTSDVSVVELRTELEAISPTFGGLFDCFKSHPEITSAIIQAFVVILLFILQQVLNGDSEPIRVEQRFYGPATVVQGNSEAATHEAPRPTRQETTKPLVDIQRLIDQAVRETIKEEIARARRAKTPVPQLKPRSIGGYESKKKIGTGGGHSAQARPHHKDSD